MSRQVDVEKVAKGLTPALQRQVLSLGPVPQRRSITWCVRFGYRLERMGIARRTLLTDSTKLTPLGLAVRDYLLKEQGSARLSEGGE